MKARSWNGSMPARMARLPLDRRGFPVPWFVAWQDGEPVFPAMDPAKLRDAIRFSRCWVCGEPLGANKAFVIGPMCVCNRVTAEPPSHLDCARFSVMNCPFLANPRMRRVPTEKYVPEGEKPHVAGIMIERNPGVSAIWVTKKFAVEKEPGGVLFRLGDYQTISFWAEGRPATRNEVEASVSSGLPYLYRAADRDGPDARRMLDRQVSKMMFILDRFPWPVADDVDLKALYGEANGGA